VIDWNAPAIVEKVRRGALRGVMIGVGIVEAHAVLLITSGQKTGRTYRRRGVVHQASAPGQAPASDTGRLVQSRKITLDTAAIRARLAFHAAHAAKLEHGTRKMEPRPFARRALVEKAREVRAAVSGEIMVELRKP
jgi:hypothetical protein